MTIRFTKMHGLGNDFMVIDAIHQKIDINPKLISAWGDRYTGIGFDQCLLIEQSTTEGVDFNYRIFNADGQEVGQCGNGARCLALFAKHYGLTTKNNLIIATKTTIMHLGINPDNTVTVDMGRPQLDPRAIPFQASAALAEYTLELKDGSASIHALSVGNPHAVLLVDDISLAPVATIGEQISKHPRFPEQVNAGFMQVIDSKNIKLRVYERGCGETKACGSGAVAAAAIGRLYYQLSASVSVQLPGGTLLVEWPNINESIKLTGPGTFVYEGVLLL